MWNCCGKCRNPEALPNRQINMHRLHSWMKSNQYCIEWIQNCNHFPLAAHFRRDEMWQVGRRTIFLLWKYFRFSLVFVSVATKCSGSLRFYEFLLLHVRLKISIRLKSFIPRVAVSDTVCEKRCRVSTNCAAAHTFNLHLPTESDMEKNVQQTSWTHEGGERTFVMNKFLVRWKIYAAQFLL